VTLAVRRWGGGTRYAVLLHGMSASSRVFHRLGPALADRGFHVVAPDLPGHGRSEADPDATIESFADAVLDSVPARPALAVGHSMGGMVLAVAAERLGAGHAAYLDIGLTTAPLRDDPLPRMRAGHGQRTAEWVRTERPWFSEEEVAIEVEAARSWDPATSASFVRSAAGRDLTPRDTTRSSLVVADPSDYVSAAERGRLAGLGFTVHAIEGGRHTLMYGWHDELLTALLEDVGEELPADLRKGLRRGPVEEQQVDLGDVGSAARS
jgi:pimeloyl-ACP methyl ester carboxylesterase